MGRYLLGDEVIATIILNRLLHYF